MKFCPVCGAELSDDEKYCCKCGSYINKKANENIDSEQEKFCAICGEPVGENNYCIKCGHKIDGAIEEKIIDKIYNERNRTGFTVLACVIAGLMLINLFSNTLSITRRMFIFRNIGNELITHFNISPGTSYDIEQTLDTAKSVDEFGFEIEDDEFDLTGMNVDSATQILKNNSVPYEVVYVSSEAHTKNTVISIDPTVRSVLDGNASSVKVYVSAGTYGSYSNDGNYQALYQINITDKVKKLNVRTSPTTTLGDSNIIDSVKSGAVFNVYETLNNDGYNWYRISDNEWIADDGTWTEIDPYVDASQLWDEFEIEYYSGDDEKNIYNCPSEYDRKSIGTIYLGDVLTCYYEFDTSKHRWYKIGANMWIKDNYGNEITYH